MNQKRADDLRCDAIYSYLPKSRNSFKSIDWQKKKKIIRKKFTNKIIKKAHLLWWAFFIIFKPILWNTSHKTEKKY